MKARHSTTAKAAAYIKNSEGGGAPLVLPEPGQMFRTVYAYVKEILMKEDVKGAMAVFRDLIGEGGLKNWILSVFHNLQTKSYKSSGAPYTRADKKAVDCLYEMAKVDCIRRTVELILEKTRREKDRAALVALRDGLVGPVCGAELEDWYTTQIVVPLS